MKNKKYKTAFKEKEIERIKNKVYKKPQDLKLYFLICFKTIVLCFNVKIFWEKLLFLNSRS